MLYQIQLIEMCKPLQQPIFRMKIQRIGCVNDGFGWIECVSGLAEFCKSMKCEVLVSFLNVETGNVHWQVAKNTTRFCILRLQAIQEHEKNNGGTYHRLMCFQIAGVCFRADIFD
jgi:hypothetical protein